MDQNSGTENQNTTKRNEKPRRAFILTENTIVYEAEPNQSEQTSNSHPQIIQIASHLPVELRRDILAFVLTVLTTIISLFTLLLVAKYTYFAGGQLIEMQKAAMAASQSAIEAKKANMFARGSLVSLQRAFIMVNPIPQMGTTSKGGHDDAWFNFLMENTGSTQTKKLRAHINTLIGRGPIPINFLYPDGRDPDGLRDDTVSVIAPKGTFPLTGHLSKERYESFLKGEVRVFFYGWVRYTDIFDDTPDHLTRFCYELQYTGLARLPNGQQGPGLRTLVSGTRFNCYDEECDEKAPQ